jgi:transcriptional antiterminator NusG
MPLKWYVIRTYSGHEGKVKANIEKMTQARSMGEKIGQLVIPMIKVAEMRGGKKRVIEKKFMPGYLLAELDMDDDLQFFIRSLPSVAGFVGSPDPQPLTEEEVRNLMNTEGSVEEEQQVKARMLFRVGETVKIVDGPFSNFTGVVDEIMPEKGKLRVKVEIFGQSTPVELDYLQVAANEG